VVLVENTSNATIKNLTVDGTDNGNSYSILTGIAYKNAGGLVENCQILSIRNNPPYNSSFGYGLFAVANEGTDRSLTVRNNQFILFQKLGASFLGANLTATVEGNTIEGAGMLPTLAQHGIQMSFNVTGTISNNTIKNITGLASATAIGIFVRDTRAGVAITGNQLTNCETAIYCLNSSGSVVNNNKILFEPLYVQSQPVKPDPVDEYYRWGILVRQGTYRVEGNEVDGGGQGTGIDGFARANESTFLEARYNIVKNLTAGISMEVDQTPACVGGEIHYNSITNSEEPIYYQPDETYPGNCPPPCVTCNWYGSANEQDFAPKFVGGHLFDYTPWLTSGTDTDPATPGFQPQTINGCSCEGFDVKIKAQKDILCYGDDDGEVTLTITGGTAPYTYKLDAQDYVDVPAMEFTIQDLAVGEHTVIVKDAKGYTHTLTVTIGQPAAPLSAEASSKTDASCNSTATGSVTITATGGTAPYAIAGREGTFASSVTITGLAAGEHTFNITDKNGCPDQVTVEIGEPSKLVLEATNPVDACSGSNGAVTITASGGTAPYTGDIGTKNNLAPGSYTFTVTDAKGCVATINVTIEGTGAGSGFNPASETFPYTFNTSFTRSLYNKTFTGSSGTWTVFSDENATMVVTKPYYAPSTSHALKVVNFKTANCGSSWTKAISPKLNLAGPCCPGEVKFVFTLWTYNVVCNDTKAKLEFDFSADGGATWTEVWSRTSGQLWSAYGANGKVTLSIPVPVAFQNNNFRYRIRGEMASGNYNNFYVFIDDIHVTSPGVCTPLGSIGNFVWKDVNANGIQEAGEPGIAGATVKLTLPNSTTVTKTTDANGGYSFTGLAAGNYTVTFTTPTGLVPTTSNAGSNDAVDSDPVNGSVTVALGVGQHNNTVDAGFREQVCTNTVSHKETFPNKFNTYFNTSLYNKYFTGSSGTWTVASNNRATMVVTTPYYAPSTSHALKVVNYNTNGCSAGWTRAVSPKINLSEPCCPSELKMTFTLWTYKVVKYDTKAKLEIDFSKDNGATWTEVWSKSSAALYYYYGANGKATVTIAVPLAFQNSNFRYRIRGEMAAGDCYNFYVFMDDIRIGSPANCASGSYYTQARTSGGEARGEEAGSNDTFSLGDKAKIRVEEEKTNEGEFSVVSFPNPSADQFNLRISSASSESVELRVTDAVGRMIKTMRTAPNTTLRLGTGWKAGTYLVELAQGTQKQTLKLIKL
jgi:hypothetical protein